jgi:hypothetical protein
MSSSPLIELERHTIYENPVDLPRTAEQVGWIAPAIIAACILVVAILAMVVVRRTVRKRVRLRRALTAMGVLVAVLAGSGAAVAVHLSQPGVRIVRSTENTQIPSFLSRDWQPISDATLHKRIQQHYGLDVPDRYLERIQGLRGAQYSDKATKPVRIVAQDGSAVRECNVWATRSEPVTVVLHCD